MSVLSFCLISGLVFVGNGSFESREYLKGSLHDFQECEHIKFCFHVEAFFVLSVELVKTMKVTLKYLRSQKSLSPSAPSH